VGRFTPYAFAGLGVSFVSIPKVEIDELQNVIDITQDVTGYFSNVFGGGIDFALNPPKKNNGENNKKKSTIYLLYLEAFYTRIPKITVVSIHRFNLISINLGIKTSL